MLTNFSDNAAVINLTKNEVIASVKTADSFFSRFKGLMLQKTFEGGLILKLPKGRGRKGSAIHMFFMRMSLDVIFLDNKKEVVDVITLDPWQTYTPKVPARFIVEFEKGKYEMPDIGDKLDFTCLDV
jgi:uncharacterized membrane protein (UPF0127 family)